MGGGFVAAIATASVGRGWGRLNEVVRIPLINYLLVFILAWLVLELARLFRRRAAGTHS